MRHFLLGSPSLSHKPTATATPHGIPHLDPQPPTIQQDDPYNHNGFYWLKSHRVKCKQPHVPSPPSLVVPMVWLSVFGLCSPGFPS